MSRIGILRIYDRCESSITKAERMENSNDIANCAGKEEEEQKSKLVLQIQPKSLSWTTEKKILFESMELKRNEKFILAIFAITHSCV